MLLIGVKASNGWLLSRWNLTYRVGWEHICKAIHAAYESYMQPEILTDNKPAAIGTRDDILKLKEKGSMTFRGLSTILKVPVMITFVNKTNVVDVNVAQATDEFSEADYQKINVSLCQYMDSMELAMYRLKCFQSCTNCLHRRGGMSESLDIPFEF